MNTELFETEKKSAAPPQPMPGRQEEMAAKPVAEAKNYVASGKLKGKVALITGGDSGIGQSVAYQFAKEGADICIVYLDEKEDAEVTMNRIEELGRRALQFEGDIGEPDFCEEVVLGTLQAFGRIDILVNNAGEQYEVNGVQDLEPKGLEKIFRTNIFGFFYLTKAALPHLKEGASIINTTSVQAYDPSPHLMPYACTKAAIVSFTRSLAKQLAEKKIRVNAVAPGPIWTPLIPSTFKPEELKKFGKKTLFKRAGQPVEVAPAYLYLATEADSSFVTGQVLHINGGQAMAS